jgi:hypothetical protein
MSTTRVVHDWRLNKDTLQVPLTGIIEHYIRVTSPVEIKTPESVTTTVGSKHAETVVFGKWRFETNEILVATVRIRHDADLSCPLEISLQYPAQDEGVNEVDIQSFSIKLLRSTLSVTSVSPNEVELTGGKVTLKFNGEGLHNKVRIDFDPPGLLEQDGRLRTNLSGNGITGDWKTVRKSGVQQPIKVTVVNPGGGSFILDDAFMVRSLSSSQLGTIRAVWQWLFTIIAVVLLLDVIIPGLTKFQNITVWPPILGCIGFALISAAVKQSRREGPTTTLTIFGCSFIAMSILAIWLSSVGGN